MKISGKLAILLCLLGIVSGVIGFLLFVTSASTQALGFAYYASISLCVTGIALGLLSIVLNHFLIGT